ncbi:right-handed parallel beta-helix repeat-containing protein [Sphingomonas sp. SRS2]|uniref:right-handed parallel beta-helix repeat-containing protein n=1 Tax=Sphingomonas sp. SRS2 TaxID=133190 RepID=UPI000618430B|nr:right-handed parallel beta-helix repeat-containing protein [Sphingomonas sp. SRS2]KKC26069.1 hypothetical protein WP12_10705 [Sphingomonas sp. SRS2]
MRFAWRFLASLSLGLSATAVMAASPRTLTVCPAKAAGCFFQGGGGIQKAIDAAADGDTVRIKAGRYSTDNYRDVPYKVHQIRGFLVVSGKSLTITGDDGAVLDGSTGPATTALVIDHASLAVSGLTITGFRWDVQEDEIYDGHGIFAIDSDVRIADVKVEKFLKMGLVGRGDTHIRADRLTLSDGHVAIWLREGAQLDLRNSIVRHNEGSGVAAYDNTYTRIVGSVFDGLADDVLYAENSAGIHAIDTLILNSKPFAAHALNDSAIWIEHSAIFANADISKAEDKSRIWLGKLITTDPMVDANYKPRQGSPLLGAGQPDVLRAKGQGVDIGPNR